jgi:hypothetical protein
MPNSIENVFPFRMLNQYREKAGWKCEFRQSQYADRATCQRQCALLADELPHAKKRRPDQCDLEKKNTRKKSGEE